MFRLLGQALMFHNSNVKQRATEIHLGHRHYFLSSRLSYRKELDLHMNFISFISQTYDVLNLNAVIGGTCSKAMLLGAFVSKSIAGSFA